MNQKLQINCIRTIRRGEILLQATVFVVAVAMSQLAYAQTFSVIHTFTGGIDGAGPQAALTVDRQGNLYGTTSAGGDHRGVCGATGCGTVFKLARHGSEWVFNPLYAFTGGDDGLSPEGTLAIGDDGSVYGTTVLGGGGLCLSTRGGGCGQVFKLQPPASSVCNSPFCPWTKTTLYQFSGFNGNSHPHGLIFGPDGNLYGAAAGVFGSPYGNVFSLASSGGSWIFSVLYTFENEVTGQTPLGDLVFDQDGDIDGTTQRGGESSQGIIYKLTSTPSGWTEQLLHNFDPEWEGGDPSGGLIIDGSGNLFGGTPIGALGPGTVFEMSMGSPGFQPIYTFFGGACANPRGVVSDLAMDSSGNLYGAMVCGGDYGFGTIFKMTHDGGGFQNIYQFQNGSDGLYPVNVVLGPDGNLYGTAQGGSGTGCIGGCGVVFQIAPITLQAGRPPCF